MPRVPRRPWLPLLMMIATLPIGCGPAQVEHRNRDLIESLLTAVSARNTEWLAENMALIEARRADGTLGDSDAKALEPIVAHARAGRWAEAETLAFDLRDAQRPTAEDATADAKRSLPPPHDDPAPRGRSSARRTSARS